ncbi:MAG: tRNA uridine(34) 5-carboxymethylaminomethyl modification radical SAM/GNAT enzyme Elp3 [Candidatus Thorarchaeota archaeon]
MEVSEIEKVKKIARATIDYILQHPNTPKEKITNIKGRFAKEFQYNGVVKNATILDYSTEEEKKIITKLLRRRTTRTLSGVSVIAIMTKPLPCPGACIYCPGQDSQPGQKVAQSYTGQEPAAMRSINNNYDPFKQVQSRITDLEAIGHDVDKIELVVMGGTFLSTNVNYQEEFIKGAYEGVINKKTNSLNQAKKFAERSKRRLIGLTIETRPDFCKEIDVDRMLNYGTTRVEIGVQTVYNEIYTLINRGHTIRDTIDSIRIAKDAGLKVNAHMMPNLIGSNRSKDIQAFEVLFSEPDFRPDMLKIYPCLVIKGTELYNLWKKGLYQPYSDKELVDLIANIKKDIPPYVRIQRIMRDIPAQLIEAGCKKSNLRQLVQKRMNELNIKCSCIRCREFGIKKRKEFIDEESYDKVKFYKYHYEASQGEEMFLSYENKDENYLMGYLRLRKPSNFAHRAEINDGKTMLVREIRVVGELVPKDIKPTRGTQIQHRGFGKSLMLQAEKESLEKYDAKKLTVISGIGARDWFYDLGYKKDGPYVSKLLV